MGRTNTPRYRNPEPKNNGGKVQEKTTPRII